MLNGSVLSRDQVLHQFLEIQRQQRAREAQMSTKAEEAQRAQQDSVVSQARTYTVEGIVQGLAALQLNFGTELDRISDTLAAEANKLDELKSAIDIEQERIEQLEAIRISAEALALLTVAHERERARFEERASSERAALTEEMSTTRAAWRIEQQEHDEAVAEYEARRAKERTAAEEAFDYERDQQRQHNADAYQQRHTELVRTLAAQQAEAERDWIAREAVLADAADEIAALLARDAAFPEELKAAKDKARVAAIKKVKEGANIAAQIAERAFEAKLKVHEAQVDTLTEQIAAQAEQITSLLAQLDVAATQSQELAVKAIDTSARPAAS